MKKLVKSKTVKTFVFFFADESFTGFNGRGTKKWIPHKLLQQ